MWGLWVFLNEILKMKLVWECWASWYYFGKNETMKHIEHKLPHYFNQCDLFLYRATVKIIAILICFIALVLSQTKNELHQGNLESKRIKFTYLFSLEISLFYHFFEKKSIFYNNFLCIFYFMIDVKRTENKYSN